MAVERVSMYVTIRSHPLFRISKEVKLYKEAPTIDREPITRTIVQQGAVSKRKKCVKIYLALELNIR